MDVFEAVDSRIACRAFFDKPVDLAIVKDLILRAGRAASGGNLQSWNVYALTGKPLAEFKAIVQKRIAKEDPRHCSTEYQVYPEPMFGAYKDRREDHGIQLYGSLGIDRNAKFIQPENMRKEMMYDYMNIEKIAPPGAEGANEGNGKANQYLDTSAPTVPTDSKLSPEEQKVLKEATMQRNSPQGSIKVTVTDANQTPPPPKKKEGFFKRLFGGKKKD